MVNVVTMIMSILQSDVLAITYGLFIFVCRYKVHSRHSLIFYPNQYDLTEHWWSTTFSAPKSVSHAYIAVWALFYISEKSIWHHTGLMVFNLLCPWIRIHIRQMDGDFFSTLNPTNDYRCKTSVTFRNTHNLATRVNEKYCITTNYKPLRVIPK